METQRCKQVRKFSGGPSTVLNKKRRYFHDVLEMSHAEVARNLLVRLLIFKITLVQAAQVHMNTEIRK